MSGEFQGGVKAVIWTDFVQGLILTGGVIAILIAVREDNNHRQNIIYFLCRPNKRKMLIENVIFTYDFRAV